MNTLFIPVESIDLEHYKEMVIPRIKAYICDKLLINIDDYMYIGFSVEEDEPRCTAIYKMWFRVTEHQIHHIEYRSTLIDGYLAEYVIAEQLGGRFVKDFSERGFKLIKSYEEKYCKSSSRR